MLYTKHKKKDLIYRSSWYRYELNKRLKWALLRNCLVKRNIKGHLRFLLSKKRYGFRSLIRNYSFIGGYSRSVYKDYRLNRSLFKSLVGKGLFPGVMKGK